MTKKDYNKEFEYMSRTMKQLSMEIPNALAPFMDNERVHAMEGLLDVRTKDLIALAMAIAQRSEGCIMMHINNALKHGASKGEILETLGVAVREAGSPAVVSACVAYRALSSLTEETIPALLYDD